MRSLDRALRSAVARAGAPAGIRFTERQLYYELCRVLHPLHRAPRRPSFTLAPPVSYARFRAALAAYQGPVPGLLDPPEPVRRERAGRFTAEPDLFDYGLPRLLVCASDAVAGMLRANGLPTESACPVYGAGELPLDPGVVRMLGLAERATVHLLHDASPAGIAFPARFARAAGLPPGVRVVALGLRPRQAGALHLTHGRRPPSEGRGPYGAERLDSRVPLGSWERRWLERGRFAEVAAVPPASLLRTVHRMVREVRAPRPAWTELRGARDVGFMSWPTG